MIHKCILNKISKIGKKKVLRKNAGHKFFKSPKQLSGYRYLLVCYPCINLFYNFSKTSWTITMRSFFLIVRKLLLPAFTNLNAITAATDGFHTFLRFHVHIMTSKNSQFLGSPISFAFSIPHG